MKFNEFVSRVSQLISSIAQFVKQSSEGFESQSKKRDTTVLKEIDSKVENISSDFKSIVDQSFGSIMSNKKGIQNHSVDSNEDPGLEIQLQTIIDDDESNQKSYIDDLVSKNEVESDSYLLKKEIISVSMGERLQNDLFDEVLINEQAWKMIKHNRGSTRVPVLVKMIEKFYVSDGLILKSNKIRKLDNNIFKIRFTDKFRITFSIIRNEGKEKLVFWDLLTHSEGERIHSENYHPLFENYDLLNLTQDVTLERTSDISLASMPNLFRTWENRDIERLENEYSDLKWDLSPKQKEIMIKKGPVLMKGSAGSGKTTIAIYRLLHHDFYDGKDGLKKLYVTYTPYLKNDARKIYRSLAFPDKFDACVKSLSFYPAAITV